MKLVAETRRLKTPQSSVSGRVRKNINGEPVYTEYLKLTPTKRFDTVQHMRRYIDNISNFNDYQFEILASKIDFEAKTQIDNEPVAYTFLQRLEIVIERLQSDNDLTMGIIDMYNHVVCKTLRALEFPANELEKARIVIEDPELRRMRNMLNPDLFELGEQ